ncbi:MAG: hypothetical protein FJ206_04860 [Gemmatimonadetes bacterium]|nr:hypothetical protein [Gemmatimonadota bacterium]
MPNVGLRVFVTKELRDLKSSPQVWPGYLILPLLGVVLPVVFLALAPLDLARAADPDLVSLMRFAARDPWLARYPEAERLPRLVVRDFGAFFLLMPVMLSALAAALAIAAEKQQRTLEPILATPLSDQEFVLAKLAAVLVPAIAVTWIAAGGFVVAVAVVTAIRYRITMVPGAAFWVSLVALAPVGGAAAALLGMRVSIKARDVQGAVQTASLWVIPAGIALVATLGRVAVRHLLGSAIAVLVALLVAAWLYRGTLRRFQREEILTRLG